MPYEYRICNVCRILCTFHMDICSLMCWPGCWLFFCVALSEMWFTICGVKNSYNQENKCNRMSERNSYISNVHTYTDSYEYVSMEGIQMRWNMWKIYVWNEYQKAYFYMLTFEQNQTNGKKSYVKTERRIEEGAEVTFKGVSFLLNKLYFSIFIFIHTYLLVLIIKANGTLRRNSQQTVHQQPAEIPSYIRSCSKWYEEH